MLNWEQNKKKIVIEILSQLPDSQNFLLYCNTTLLVTHNVIMWMWLRYVIFNILSYTSYRHYKLIADLTDFLGEIQIKGKKSSIALPLDFNKESWLL